MKLSPLLLLLALSATASADPQISSWLTDFSTKYARIYTSDANKNAGNSVPTWSNTRSSQSLPAYCGVQEISSSTSWVYVARQGWPVTSWARGTTTLRAPSPSSTSRRISGRSTGSRECRWCRRQKVNVQGEIGFFVDGVHAFDSSDAVSYSNANARDGDAPGTPNGVTGDGIWNRDAYINEAITFDNALAHQQNTGVYHYHANPIGLRHLLGDHVDFNPSTKAYSESTTPVTSHSPIVGWAKDGYPIYGPYGYSSRLDPNSGVRRMVTGYVPRNGQNGTTNLATTGRTSLPAWAQRVQNRPTLTSTQYGPTVSTSFPLGRYLEDNDYLGDLGKVQGTDFDLDEHNGRTCVTPEFPRAPMHTLWRLPRQARRRFLTTSGSVTMGRRAAIK
jgi:hypothetical protein